LAWFPLKSRFLTVHPWLTFIHALGHAVLLIHAYFFDDAQMRAGEGDFRQWRGAGSGMVRLQLIDHRRYQFVFAGIGGLELGVKHFGQFLRRLVREHAHQRADGDYSERIHHFGIRRRARQ
jgi:hypothetical protein